ncbi:MAG TPA: hypothetical protein VGH36_01445 [Acetobacteraceae bacterium]|jgi:hypothetical protein
MTETDKSFLVLFLKKEHLPKHVFFAKKKQKTLIRFGGAMA